MNVENLLNTDWRAVYPGNSYVLVRRGLFGKVPLDGNSLGSYPTVRGVPKEADAGR